VNVIFTAICDDYPAQAQIISALLTKYQAARPGLHIKAHTYGSGAELLKGIDSGCEYQLLLLDILMPSLNGIELAKEIRKRTQDAVMIFITISTEHALDAYAVSAAQYIVKPVQEKTLFPILDKVIPTLGGGRDGSIVLSTPESDVKILYSSIVFIELFSRKLRVYLDNGDVLLGKYLRKPFETAIAPLLEDPRFIRPHKSFVVNIDKSDELRKDALLMKGGHTVPISRLHYTGMKKRFLSQFDRQTKIYGG
jgi:DNA-binding LytR/AlgR family response regulator